MTTEIDDSYATSGEEELRFIRNFHDVFLSIGLAMLILGIALVSMLIGGPMVQGPKSGAMIASMIALVDAVIVFFLGEVFARTRRLFLPAIVILLAFVFFISLSAGWGYFALSVDEVNKTATALDFGNLTKMVGDKAGHAGLVVSLAASAACLLYYIRMKLPFAMGLFGFTAVGCLFYGLVILNAAWVQQNFTVLLLYSGIGLFLAGVYFDARDPMRRTRISDNGFWLHFFAAPMIFFSVSHLVAGGTWLTGGISKAGMILAIVGVFAFISLLINRRALLVSGLISAAVALSMVVSRAGMDGAWGVAVTLLLLGGAMVLLGGGWHSLRRVVVAPFPKTGLIARIIPPEPAKDAVNGGKAVAAG